MAAATCLHASGMPECRDVKLSPAEPLEGGRQGEDARSALAHACKSANH